MKHLYRSLIVVTALAAGGCVQAQAPTDVGDTVTTSSSTSTSSGSSGTTTTPASTGPFSYNQDVKAILDSDCLTCHGPRRTDGGYSVATYALVMRGVRAGNASSTLISVTRSGGSMYRYWSGTTATRTAKADMVRQWIVTYAAQESR